LTYGPWDDITPSASPDGSQIAFASNRAGAWDLYLLDLSNGETTRLTDTTAYDAAPSWSPDGRWLAYESYTGEADAANLEIFLLEVPEAGASASQPVQLTLDPGADYSPAWSPSGRMIAFITDRSGEAETWLADLDRMDDRFKNLSQNRETQESHPAWSPDGSSLAWGTSGAGIQTIQSCFFDDIRSSCRQRSLGSGDWPVWSPDGGTLLTSLPTPNQAYLAGYSPQAANLALPPLALNGSLTGLAWGPAPLAQPLPGLIAEAALVTPTPTWKPLIAPQAEIPAGRQRLVSLEGVAAEYPLLQDQVDDSFNALRSDAANRTGWDFLSSLENAYVPLTTPLFPGMQQDWLYTGRAFSFNPAPLHAGWVVIVREDFGSETYWRVYLRARFQDGSMGMPLQNLPWSIDARSSGDPRAYEQGGSLAGSLPGGYWIDFTQLASVYGWERLPALTTWRSAYQAARYNEFTYMGGLDWLGAMQEIYPPEALITP
jgi:TolB protein